MTDSRQRRGANTRVEAVMRYLDPLEAFRKQVLDFGVPRLAALVGKEPKYVYNKINPTQERHPLLYEEVIDWSELMQSWLSLEAWARQSGRMCVLLPSLEACADGELFESFTRLIKELGEFSTEFHDDLADGRITSRELARLRKEMGDVQSVGQELLARLERRGAANGRGAPDGRGARSARGSRGGRT